MIIQNINNNGANIGEQINISNSDLQEIGNEKPSKKEIKKMNNNNYPSWLVPLDLAKELKEIGFKEPCLYRFEHINKKYVPDHPYVLYLIIDWHAKYNEYYIVRSEWVKEYENNFNKAISIPTWEQVLEWFKKKGYIAIIDYLTFPNKKNYYRYYIKGNISIISNDTYTEYEEAREALVKELIKLYKNENHI